MMRPKRRRDELESDAVNKKFKVITDVETKNLPPRLVVGFPHLDRWEARELGWPIVVGWDWSSSYTPYIREQGVIMSSEPAYEIHTVLDWEALLAPEDVSFLSSGRQERAKAIADDANFPPPLATIIQDFAPFEETVGSFWVLWHEPAATLRRPIGAKQMSYITAIGFRARSEKESFALENDDEDECGAVRSKLRPGYWISCPRWCRGDRLLLNFPAYTTQMRYVNSIAI